MPTKTLITLPPNPKPAQTLTEFQQAVTVWTRQAEQTVRAIGKVADTASNALVTTSIPTGSTVLHGAGVPPNTLGADGNYYIDSVDLDIFLKTSGAWSILAPLGSSIGSLVLNGSGAPSGGLGVNGNYYIDSTGDNLYLKSGGVWSILVALGGTGSVVLNGSGAPSSGLGANGNYYIDTSGQNIYLKSGGAWAIILSAGSVVLNGGGVPSGGLGSNGNYYIDNTNHNIYLKTGGTWSIIFPAGGGFPSEVAAVTIATFSGTSGTITLYGVPVGGSAVYRISLYLSVHNHTSGESITFTFGWTDDDRANTLAAPTLSASAITNTVNYTTVVRAVASTNITYQYTQAVGITTQWYAYMVVERLNP